MFDEQEEGEDGGGRWRGGVGVGSVEESRSSCSLPAPFVTSCSSTSPLSALVLREGETSHGVVFSKVKYELIKLKPFPGLSLIINTLNAFSRVYF